MKKSITITGTAALLLFSTIGNSIASEIASDIRVSKPDSQGTGLYLGAKAGIANYDEADDSDGAFDLFVGFNLNEVLSIEAGWTDLGEASNSGSSVEVTALHVDIVGNMGLRSDLSLFGKIGLARWDFDHNTNATTENDSGVDLSFGVGFDYNISGRSAVRFALDFYAIDAEINNIDVDEDIMVFSVGAKFGM
ncbi:MAG: outer membrane beta-barrel protein [Gammaproteobacteria bacterium]|nr:outer membrane beta-barrel protein [Gammaproteobacteria bacterium]